MRKAIFTLVLSLVTLCSYGQSGRVIYGRVYGESKIPLHGAKIITRHGDLICTTDQSGQFNAQTTSYVDEIVVLYEGCPPKYVKVDGSYLIIKMRAAAQSYNDTPQESSSEQPTNLKEAQKVETKQLKAERKAEQASIKEAQRVETKELKVERKAERKAELEAFNEDIRGWQNMVALGIGGSDEATVAPSISVEYIGGKRFNNTLFIGFGTGLAFNTQTDVIVKDSGVGDSYSLAYNLISCPLYAKLKIYLAKTRCQPYITLSTGFRFSTKRDEPFYSYKFGENTIKYGTTQYFITPGIGIDFRIKSTSAISLEVGMQAMTVPWAYITEVGKYFHCTVKHKMQPGYIIQIGYKF